MTHELVVTAVRLKVKNFDPPAKLINMNELACAIGMAFKSLDLPLPEVNVGDDVEKVQELVIPILKQHQQLDENLMHVINSYVFKNEKCNEDSLITLQLGYDNGL